MRKLDGAFIALYTLLTIVRVILYPQDTYNYYVGSFPDEALSCKYFCFVMKILINKQVHYERPILRNIVFDAVRCLPLSSGRLRVEWPSSYKYQNQINRRKEHNIPLPK